MAAEVIFFKHASDLLSPLVSDALVLKSTVSRLHIIWPLPPLKLHLRLLYKVLVTLCNYFIYWLASPTSLSKYIAVTPHPGAQYINLSKWKPARLQISTCDLECVLEPFRTGAHFQNNAASPSHHHPFSVHSAPWPWKYHQPSLTSSRISELTFLENN